MTAPAVDAPVYVRARKRPGKVPVSTMIFQGVGILPDIFKGFAFNTFLLFYYNQVLGVPPLMAALALGICTILDGLVDPFIGSFSDNLRTPLGRRHPLMYASALPLALGLFLVFSPPAGLGQQGLFVWLLASAAMVNVSISLFSVPWTATFAELSDDYSERTTIVTWRYAIAWIGGLIFTFAIWSYVFKSTPQYTPGQLNPQAYRLFAPILAGAVFLAVLAATQLTRREIPYLIQPVAGSRFSVPGAIRELVSMLANRDFLALFGGALVFAAIAGTGHAFDTYMQTFFWGLGPSQLRWFGLSIIGAVAAFVSLPLLQKKFDKKTLMLGGFAFSVLDGTVIVSLMLAGLLPDKGTTALVVVLLANSVLKTFLGTILGIMFVSMLADALDGQELKNGRRQEGMFAAAYSFSTKATAGVGLMIAGFLLQSIIHWPAGKAPSHIDPATVTRLAVVAGICVPLAYVIPFWLGSLYRITRAEHAVIREQVEARRGSFDTPPAE